ncbi:pleckstrin homology domain-containing family G member 3-like isoform X3 [Hypanus sabinus]|uniref:pleckstrin homology domain-containing family G member 3-like isoform X3 n=2 Tax=Hypanus sabinus TaxID=79690 RepID=UPI0028C43A1E|nr:pleckstrin homology domain-containing family G member 3-like isoform X3 [Hypanus sabinus]
MPEGSLCSVKEVPSVEAAADWMVRHLRPLHSGLYASNTQCYQKRAARRAARESPRTSSTSSLSSHDRMSTITTSSISVNTDCSDIERPVSASSLSSLQDCHGPSDTTSRPGDDVRAESALPLRTLKAEREYNNNNNSVDRTNMNVNFRQLPLSPIATRAMAPNPKLSYVDRVVMEILETERMYVQHLRSIVEDYLGCIIDASDLPIRPEHVSALFGNIEDIYEFNSNLLQDLDSCHHDPVAIARCFVDKSQDFDIYTQYCTNYPNSVAALTECMRNKVLAKFFRERQSTLKRSLPLGSYLLKPVQRILKYHLLLQEIAKHFDVNQEGYEVIDEAIDTMTGVAWYINDMKRKHEHAIRLQEVQSLMINWNGPDLTTYGELVLEGTFRIHRAKNERTLLLFDKVLLLTKKRGEHFIYKTHIMCSALMLIESTRDSLCFGLSHYKNPKQQHTVQAKTVEEKRLWTHHIKRLILENHHAIIPQKAKEAILEMDSYYPSKYRYSPERLKKPMSTHEELLGYRKGRRQSEPAKRILKSLVQSVSLKHAGSDGELLGNKDSMNSLAVVSALGSSTSEPESERHDNDDDLAHSKDSLNLLNASGSEELARGTELALEDMDPEEELMIEGDQVADFASSLLAAISCWHYRARALLSAKFSTAENSAELPEAKGFKRQNSQPSANAEKRRVQEADTSVSEEVTPDVEPMSIQQIVTEACQSALEEMQSDTEATHSPEGTKGADEVPEATDAELSGPEQGTVDPAVECPFSETGDEPKHFSSEDSSEEEEQEQDSQSILPPSVLGQASLIAEHFLNSPSRCNSLVNDDGSSYSCVTPKVTNRQSSLESGDKTSRTRDTHDEWRPCDTFWGSNGQKEENLSEEESILKCQEEMELDIDRNIPKRRDSTLSRQDRLLIEKIKSYYDNAEHEDANFSIKRRESLTYIPAGLVRNSVSRLNGQNKEVDLREATLRRRLASSNVAVSQRNDLPVRALQDPPNLSSCRDAELPLEPAQALEQQQPESNDSLAGKPPLDFSKEPASGKQDPITDSEFRSPVDMIKIWQEMENMSNIATKSPKRAEQKHDTLQGFESFDNNSESPKKIEDKDPKQSQTKQLSSGRSSLCQDFNEPLVILEDGDLSATPEVSSITSQARPTGKSGLEERLNDTSVSEFGSQAKEYVPRPQTSLCVQKHKCSEAEDERAPLPASGSDLTQNLSCDHPTPVTRPQVAQAQGEELLREVTEKMKTKVYQLARIYSQRIKNTKPVVRKRGSLLEVAQGKEEERGSDVRKLVTVQEDEKETVAAADKPKESPSLPLYDQVIIQEQVPVAALMQEPDAVSPNKCLQTFLLPSTKITSPRRTVFSLITPPVRPQLRPLSPTEVETFPWPDVRELRSKYTSMHDQVTKDSILRVARTNLFKPPESCCAKLGRFSKSLSMPNGMMEGRMSHSGLLERRGKSKAGLCPSSTMGKQAVSDAVPRKMLHSDSSIQYLLKEAPGSSSIDHATCSRTTPLDSTCTDQSSSSECKFCHSTKCLEATHYVSSELTLLDDQKVIVMEKLPHDGDGWSIHRNEQVAKDNSSDDEGYVQIRSPTSREKISIRAVMERCRAYQESEEYKSRQEAEDKDRNPKAKQRSYGGVENLTSSTQQPEPRKEMRQLGSRTDLTQQGLVKNLRDKFQSLTFAS